MPSQQPIIMKKTFNYYKSHENLIDEVNNNNRMPPRAPDVAARLHNNYQTAMSSTPYKSSYRSIESDRYVSPVRNDYYPNMKSNTLTTPVIIEKNDNIDKKCSKNFNEDDKMYRDKMRRAQDEVIKSKSELLKTQLKKEQLETEIELLENKAKLKRCELKNSVVSPTRQSGQSSRAPSTVPVSVNRNIAEYDYIPNRLQTTEALRRSKSPSHTIKSGINYEDVVRLMNERDTLRNKIFFEKSTKEIERHEIENQLYQTKDEFIKEQKFARDRITRLETELETAKARYEESAKEKDDLHSKVISLENKLITLQQDLSKKERDSFNSAIAENTERHLTSLCQTLNTQLEDVKEQLKASDDRYKRLEADSFLKTEKFESLKAQHELLRKENESNVDSLAKMKKSYEEQMNNLVAKEKEIFDKNMKLLHQKDGEIYNLKRDVTEFRSKKLDKHDELMNECKETISKQDQEIQLLSEALRNKQIQMENMQRDFDYSIGPILDDRIQKEKNAWEQEQDYLIRRELSKLSEEKNKEIAKLQDDLLAERDKNLKDREKMLTIEKEMDDLKQELKYAIKEKNNAISKAKESLRLETEKLKEEILNEKYDESNRYKRIVKELQDELEQFKNDKYQNAEKEKEILQAIERLEKNLIKDLNDEQRRISAISPGLIPKIVNYSNLRSSYSIKNLDNAFALNTFQIAFTNLKTMIDELTQNYQNLKNENDQNKKNLSKTIQDKEDSIDNIKKQYERQKQKDSELIREYVHKDQNSLNSYTTEVGSLVAALKNKDKEIQEIQENMTQWKQETLGKLAEKFEIELNKELDRRMQEYKIDSAGQQMQLDKIRKEMDSLVKECRDASRNLISQDAHDRMISYYKSRMEDFRNENLSLRQRIKASNMLQHQVLSASRTNLNQDDYLCGGSINGEMVPGGSNFDDEICGGLIFSPGIDGDDHLLNKNEALQQRLCELEKLQAQLTSAQL